MHHPYGLSRYFETRHPYHTRRQRSVPQMNALSLRYPHYNTRPGGLLHRTLPKFFQMMVETKGTFESVTKVLVATSKSVEENLGPRGLRADQLRNSYRMTIDAIRGAESETSVRKAILRVLEGYLGSEKIARFDKRDHPHRPALNAFRAVAEISRQCESRALGTVLYSFFVDNAHYIITKDSVDGLALWCHGIYFSSMRQEHQHECLLMVVRHVPGLIDHLRVRSSRDLQELARVLVRLSDDFRSGHRDERSRGFNSWRGRSRLNGDLLGARRGLLSCNVSPEREYRRLPRTEMIVNRNQDKDLRPKSAPRTRQMRQKLLEASAAIKHEADMLKEFALRA